MSIHPTTPAETLRQLSRQLPQQGTARLSPGFPGSAPLALALGRVHEICGPARRTLALILAGAAAGPVLWIAPGWSAERLHAPGLARFLDPARLLLIGCRRDEDLLWCAEEALRHLAAEPQPCGTVVAELPSPPGLTPVRRLHLAAGPRPAESARRPRLAGGPLGLLLTPDTGGAPGVESRWQLTPQHPAPRDLQQAALPPEVWQLDRLRARGSGPGRWLLSRRAGDGLRLDPAPDAHPLPPGTDLPGRDAR
jgi:protein ImuA